MNIMQNDWQQKEWECCNDMPTCCLGWCCPLCLICKNAQDYGENTCLYCLLACCFPHLGICMLRRKARETYGIEGDDCKDCLCACCCGPCTSCQTQTEYKRRTAEGQNQGGGY